jgi:hypothetical protein
MMRYLWRLDGTVQQHDARWATGIAIHLRYQPLTTVLAWRQGEQRSYLVLDGCPRCRPDGCMGICPRSLFQQLVRTSLPGLTLTAVPRLTSDRDAQPPVVAVPTRRAGVLSPAVLAAWASATLITTWAQAGGPPTRITVGARMTVSRSGPAIAQMLRTLGWRVDPLATLLARRQRPTHVLLNVGRRSSTTAALSAALGAPQQLFGLPIPTPAPEAA